MASAASASCRRGLRQEPATRDELRTIVLRCLGEVAPEADPRGSGPDVSFRGRLDPDSMDFLNFAIALHQALGVPGGDGGEEGLMAAIRRILHATDFSPASRPAFMRAVELARTNRAELIAVHVMSPPILYAPDGYAAPQVYERLLADLQADAQKQLGRLVASARSRGVRARGLLLEGVPHDRITRAARSTRANLVVIGTHGRTGLARLFLGSVASRVIATAPCPVLSVRAGTRAAPAASRPRRARPARRRAVSRGGRA